MNPEHTSRWLIGGIVLMLLGLATSPIFGFGGPWIIPSAAATAIGGVTAFASRWDWP